MPYYQRRMGANVFGGATSNLWHNKYSVPMDLALFLPSPLLLYISLFGQRGRCPVEHRGELLCPSDITYILPPRALCPNLSLEAKIPACWLKSQPVDPNPNLKTQIPACWPKSQPQDPNSSLLAQI